MKENKVWKALYELLEIFKEIDREGIEWKGDIEHIVVEAGLVMGS